MEGIPEDVVTVLLHKLANQDPLSLVRATCALASFYRAAKGTPSIWKEAFYGVAGKQLQENCSRLDAEVEVLGGFKTLITSRLRVCSNSDRKNRQEDMKEKRSRPFELPGRRFESNMFPGRVLILVRLKGRLLLWGLSDKQQRSACAKQWRTFDGWIRLPFEQLYPWNHSLETMLRRAWDEANEKQSCYLTGQAKAALSIEVYAYIPKRIESQKRPGAATSARNSAYHGFFHSLDLMRTKSDSDKTFSLWELVNSEPPGPQSPEEDGVDCALGFNIDSFPGWSFCWSLEEEMQADLVKRVQENERAPRSLQSRSEYRSSLL